MKNLALKNLLTLLVLLSLALIAFSLVQAGRRSDSQETNGVQDRPDLVEAVRRGGLREGPGSSAITSLRSEQAVGLSTISNLW